MLSEVIAVGFRPSQSNHRPPLRRAGDQRWKSINYSNFFRFDVLHSSCPLPLTSVSFSSPAQFQVLHAKIGTRDSPPAITHSDCRAAPLRKQTTQLHSSLQQPWTPLYHDPPHGRGPPLVPRPLCDRAHAPRSGKRMAMGTASVKPDTTSPPSMPWNHNSQSSQTRWPTWRPISCTCS